MDSMSCEEMIRKLQEVFPNTPVSRIQYVMDIVNTENPSDGNEYKLETAINLLTETGNGTDDVLAELQQFDEAVGGQPVSIQENTISVWLENLAQVFPDCQLSYLKDIVKKHGSNFNFDAMIDDLSINGYPKKDIDPIDTYERLKELLPNASPAYLKKEANALAFKTELELKQFVENAIEKGDYPSLQDYLKSQKEHQEVRQYTTHFKIEPYLKVIPNPIEHFSDPNRQLPLSAHQNNEESLESDKDYAFIVLCNIYRFHRKKDISRLLRIYSYDLIKTTNRLDRLPKAFKNQRELMSTEDKVTKNFSLLQELAYLTHKKEIKEFLKWKDENYKKARMEAEANGLLETCKCCFDDTLIPEECYFCKKGCIFCKDCVKLGAETVIGNNELEFPCLADCGAEFSIPTLQMVLDSVVFSRMAQRKQMQEIKRANIEGLETCPYCDFSTIPATDDKVFKCLNPECMKETCRECRHIAHIPLRCSEIEYDEDVKMRTYIENKMTEALLRKCWQCNKVFVKESGCNKMTCKCGAKMCYVCGQAVQDYSHFGSGSKCPLYTENLNRFHQQAVLQGAATAKAELGVNANPAKLKFDPTRGIEQHYQG